MPGSDVRFSHPVACDRPPDCALRWRPHARRVRLWRGVPHFTGKLRTGVLAVQRGETNIGGAGNVARNIASLGARCIFIGLIGDDDAGRTLRAALAQQSLLESVLICDPGRPTTRKVRFVSEHFSSHMLRADWELAAPASAGIEQQLIDAILPRLPDADIVLLSDYAKG